MTTLQLPAQAAPDAQNKASPEPFLAPWATLDELKRFLAHTVEPLNALVINYDRAAMVTALQGFFHVFKAHKSWTDRAAEISEKPALQAYFKKFATSAQEKSLALAASESLAALGQKKAPPIPAGFGDFSKYWLRVGFANELEFIGALYFIDGISKALSDELLSSAKKLKFKEKELAFFKAFVLSGQDQASLDRTYQMREIVTEFSTTSRERIFSGAREAAKLFKCFLNPAGSKH